MADRAIYVVLGVMAVAGSANAQSDFDEYVASIRSQGMSEHAAGSVRAAAGILSGSAAFKAVRAPDGSLGRSYGGPPTTEATSREEQRARWDRAAAMEPWTEFLKSYADTDRSGFVSTREGHTIRSIVEAGLIAAQLKVTSIEALAKDLPAEDIEANLAGYSALRTEALKQGLGGMPALPDGLTADTSVK